MFTKKSRPVLPPRRLRMGGEHFKDDAAFVQSAVNDVLRLSDMAGMTQESTIMDWGCGAGRLAIGIREQLGRVREYHGVDVQPDLIQWCEEHLAGQGFRFTCLDVSNERYNPEGVPAPFLPAEPASIDVFYAYSVFSHMTEPDTHTYLGLISEALSESGCAFITCFVEEDVPAWEENPPGYGPLEWTGRLHCTRFERAHFEHLAKDAGLRVDRFVYGRETDGQSLYVLRKATGES